MVRAVAILSISALLLSCQKETKSQAVARVNDAYLYKSDIAGLVPEGTTQSDSVEIVQNFIDRWAAQKLLMKAADINLDKEKKAAFNELIKQYKVDLYTKGYLEELVKRSVDTVVGEQELKAYYNENKENFRTTGTLVRLRYINLPKDHPKFAQIRAKFLDFRKSDKKFWDVYQVQFRTSALNDTIWVEMNEIYRRLPFVSPDNRATFISSGMSYERPAAGGNVYLVKIREVIDQNQIAPFDYLRPTLREVIVNRRKLELIKKFEKEITDDALKNDQYEIYKK